MSSYECLPEIRLSKLFRLEVHVTELSHMPRIDDPIYTQFGLSPLDSFRPPLNTLFREYVEANGPVVLQVYFKDFHIVYDQNSNQNRLNDMVGDWVSSYILPVLNIEGIYMTWAAPGLDPSRTRIPGVELVPIHLNPLTKAEIGTIVHRTVIKSVDSEMTLANLIRNHNGKIRGVYKLSEDEDPLDAFVRCLHEFSSGKPRIVRDVLLSGDWALDRLRYPVRHDIYRAMNFNWDAIMELHLGLRKTVDPFSIDCLNLTVVDGGKGVIIPPATRTVISSLETSWILFLYSLSDGAMFHTEVRPLVLLMVRFFETIFRTPHLYASDIIPGFIRITSGMGKAHFVVGTCWRYRLSEFGEILEKAEDRSRSFVIYPSTEEPDFFICIPREMGRCWLVAVVVHPPRSLDKVLDGLRELVGVCSAKNSIPEKLWIWWCDPSQKVFDIAQAPREKSVIFRSTFISLPLEIIWMNLENPRVALDFFSEATPNPNHLLDLITDILSKSL